MPVRQTTYTICVEKGAQIMVRHMPRYRIGFDVTSKESVMSVATAIALRDALSEAIEDAIGMIEARYEVEDDND